MQWLPQMMSRASSLASGTMSRGAARSPVAASLCSRTWLWRHTGGENSRRMLKWKHDVSILRCFCHTSPTAFIKLTGSLFCLIARPYRLQPWARDVASKARDERYSASCTVLITFIRQDWDSNKGPLPWIQRSVALATTLMTNNQPLYLMRIS